jgi:hypothetical protein
VPYLGIGAILLVVPLDLSVVPPEIGLDEQLRQANLTPEDLVTALRVMAGTILVLALLYILFAVLAFLGHSWARIVVTIMTAGFTILMLLIAVSALMGGDIVSTVLALMPVALIVGGTVIMFLADSSRWFQRARG